MPLVENMWGELIEIPDEKEKVKKVKQKIANPKETKQKIEKQLESKELSVNEKLKLIEEEVLRVLYKQKDNIRVIYDRNELDEYITQAIKNGRINIDTETSGLDPLNLTIWGACFYTPGEKQVYVPLNHIDLDGNRLSNQLNEKDIEEVLQRIDKENIFTIYANGKYDYQVFKCVCNNIETHIDWDVLIGAHLIDDNLHDDEYALKWLYCHYIDPEQEKYDIEKLFGDPSFYGYVPPEIFALYAATDAMMTDKLYEYQLNILKQDDLKKVLSLATNIEMPAVKMVGDLELAGMQIDQSYAQRLFNKFNNRLNKIDAQIQEQLSQMHSDIETWSLSAKANEQQWKKLSEKQWANAIKSNNYNPELFREINGDHYKISKSKMEQLDNINLTPEDLASPVKLGILLYDILKCPIVNKEKPYATGEEELKNIYDKTSLDICKLILKRRELTKLISTYIDPIPKIASESKDGRIRTHFWQYGAATGRFSSSKPVNFQNIPSHEKSIRLMFCAKKGYKIIGSDFSGQEPRTLAFMSGDPIMIKAYQDSKDLYAEIAAMSFNKDYNDCLEFYPPGTEIIFEGKKVITGKKTHTNVEGKGRRTAAKSILLG